MGLMDMLSEQLGGGNLGQIGRQLGTDEKTAGSAVSAALPILLGALAKNASRPEGAASLAGALEKDHDGSILDNLPGFLGNPQAGPGDGILRHLLGDKRSRVESSVGKATGLDAASVSKLLVTLAPLVMGMLGRQKQQQGLDPSGLAGLLGQERSAVESKLPGGALGSLLDADGDGDVDLGDLARGSGMLGKLFGK